MTTELGAHGSKSDYRSSVYSLLKSRSEVAFAATVQISKAEADEFLKLPENHFRERKSKEIKPAKLTKSASAFANSSGGELYIGIEERSDGSVKLRNWNGFADQEVFITSRRRY